MWALRVASLQNVCLAHACLAVGGDSPLRPIETVNNGAERDDLHALSTFAFVADLCMYCRSLDASGVSCTGAEGDFRVTDIRAEASVDLQSGIPEVFHAGAWGTVCEGDLGFFQVRTPRCIHPMST